MDQLMGLINSLAGRRLICLLSRNETLRGCLTRLETDHFASRTTWLWTASSWLMWCSRSVCHYGLLAETHNVFKVIGLGCVLSSCYILWIEHERTRGIIWSASEIKLLRLATFRTISSCAHIASCRVEVNQIPRREVHVLHICTLLIPQVCWWYVHVLSVMAWNGTLKHELWVRNARRACILGLIALVLISCLWLFALDWVGAIPLSVDQWQLLLVCKSIC